MGELIFIADESKIITRRMSVKSGTILGAVHQIVPLQFRFAQASLLASGKGVQTSQATESLMVISVLALSHREDLHQMGPRKHT